MRRKGAWGVVYSLLLCACGGGGGSDFSPAAPTPPQPTPTPEPPKVVVISVDGLRPDALTPTQAPAIFALAEAGAYTWQAQTILPSNTLPAHVSMLSGYLPARHKVTWDEYYPEKGRIAVPTLFSAIRAAGRQSVMIVGKQKFATFRDTGVIDTFVESNRGDDDVANQALVWAQTGFDFMFIHLPSTDLCGHDYGWMSKAYLAQLLKTDQAVNRIVSALPPLTTVILTSDHGGQGRNHGSDTPLHTTVPWIVAGPRIRPGLLNVRVSEPDTAATAAYLLGVALPPDATGRPVFEAFAR